MRKALIIIAYFGTFPTEFPFWLHSCEANGEDGYDWLLITDQYNTKKKYIIPANVKIITSTFAQFRERVQKCFDFQIILEHPQKICDYKPAFGLVFKNYLNDYLYWGHCDMDLIWGKLDSSLAIPISQLYERILELGHLSLYLNNEKMLNAFKGKVEGCLYYKDVYMTKSCMTFDEDGWPLDSPKRGLSTIFSKTKINVYKSPNCFADVNIGTYNISPLNFVEKNISSYYQYDKNRLYHIFRNKEWIQREIIYVHAQKRKWRIMTNNYDKFYFIPPGQLTNDINNYKINQKIIRLFDNFIAIKKAIRKRIKYFPENLKTLILLLHKKVKFLNIIFI